MKLIKAKYIVVGTKLSKSGAIVKVFANRLTLECPACGSHVVRHSFRCLKQRSCGCVNQHVTHGETRAGNRTPLYQAWAALRNRCSNPKNGSYHRYGGRGIKVCKQWDSFIAFRNWAMSSGWKSGLVLDRKNNDGNYKPSNCRWLTLSQSGRNSSLCKLGFNKAKAMRELNEAGWSITRLAKLFGVVYATAKDVVINHSWPKGQEF